MSNLYNVTTNQEAIRALTKALDRLSNLQPSLDVYPDRPTPVVRNTADGREMAADLGRRIRSILAGKA